jgi:serine/threonine protein kinase
MPTICAATRITDFGIAVMMEAPVAGGAFVGTAVYVSPEQAKGEALSPPSEIYSLGLGLLECLTGVVSYPGEPLPRALARLLHSPDIPADLDPQWVRLLTSMTATDPAARPSGRETAMSLGEISPAEKDRRSGDQVASPPDEAGRMEVVHRYQILDSPQDGAFDRITALAARLFSVPIAITPWWPASSACSSTRVFHCAPVTAITWARCASLTANRAPLNDQDLRTLEDLAAIVMNDLEQRMQSRRVA